MRLLGGLLDRIILLAAVLAAACVPSFIVQYRQRLGGQLDQLHADLAPFQVIANQNFGGSLSKLIQYHLASSDPTFHREGAALQTMVDAAARLQAALQALNTDVLHQSLYLIQHTDPGLARATWSAYQPAFTWTPQGAAFALAVGLILWLLFLSLWHGTGALLRSVALPRARRGFGTPPRRV